MVLHHWPPATLLDMTPDDFATACDWTAAGLDALREAQRAAERDG